MNKCREIFPTNPQTCSAINAKKEQLWPKQFGYKGLVSPEELQGLSVNFLTVSVCLSRGCTTPQTGGLPNNRRLSLMALEAGSPRSKRQLLAKNFFHFSCVLEGWRGWARSLGSLSLTPFMRALPSPPPKGPLLQTVTLGPGFSTHVLLKNTV